MDKGERNSMEWMREKEREKPQSFRLERCHFSYNFISKPMFRESNNTVILYGKGFSTLFHNWILEIQLWLSWLKSYSAGWNYEVGSDRMFIIFAYILHMNWAYVKR